ncbi:MAG: PepSY-like domain-containing protein [Alistipes sp.]|nr:PepSY-like domain-containing protein [Alistipes sp.]
MEFDRNGEWKEVEVRTGSIPAAIIPQQIRQYLDQNYPDTPVRQIDRDRRGYEVKLVNGLELEFNNNFALIKIDY